MIGRIALAKEAAFIQEEGLANELAARFYLSWGNQKVATRYMCAAYYCYSHWGAKNKVRHLEQRYPNLLEALTLAKNPVAAPAEAVMTTVMHVTHDTHNTAKDSWLDFPAVIQAAQAISQEIELDSLLARLVQIAIANAGAQTGHLILQQDEQWQVVAAADQTRTESLSVPLQQCFDLPQNLIQYVARTQEVAVFEDLSANLQFASETYIVSHQPKSALCLPISRQEKLIGILYLENNVTKGAFTSDRIEILQLLTSQAAISLENAKLHQQTVNYSQTLEKEVAKKTKDLEHKATDLEQALSALQQTQAQLIHTEKMSSLGKMVAGVAHEINNPATFIRGNVEHARGYIQDLTDLIERYQSEYPQENVNIQAFIKEIDLDFVHTDLENILHSMESGSERIQNIVLNLRDFSHLDESGIKAVDLHRGLDSTLGILQSRLQSEQLTIAVTKHYGALPVVSCDPSQINQVFLYILSNAIDAIEASADAEQAMSPAISLTTQTGEDGGVEVAIANNGDLIPEGIQSQIFDPFFTTKEVGSGTGLGLFVSYSIVQQHGGELTVQSTPQLGTVFTLQLPAQPLNEGTTTG